VAETVFSYNNTSANRMLGTKKISKPSIAATAMQWSRPSTRATRKSSAES